MPFCTEALLWQAAAQKVIVRIDMVSSVPCLSYQIWKEIARITMGFSEVFTVI